jgi:hypothetical protein
MKTTILATTIAATVIAVAPGFAHHSDVAYDQSKQTQLKNATVVNVAWRNPHTIFVVDVKNDGDHDGRWTLETGSPSSLSGNGWIRTSVQAGDEVTLLVNPARNGTKFGRLVTATKADGKVYRWGSALAGDPAPR